MINHIESGLSFHQERKEQEPEWKLVKRIVISGHPGSGKTYVIGELAKRYGLNENQVIKVGDLFREWYKKKTGIYTTGYIDRELSVDREFDQFQMNLLSDEDPNKVFILESKLGGFLTWIIRSECELKGKSEPPIFPILLIIKESFGNERVWERDKKKNPTLTQKESERETKNRKIRDLKQWQKLYPILTVIGSPLGYKARALYDWWINTQHFSKIDIVEKIHKSLVENGAVIRAESNRKKEPEEQIIPQQGQIFPSSTS